MSIKAMSVMGCDGGITRRNLCRHNCCDGENCVTWLEKQFAKLNEYEQAKAEGRLVVLPCKVGDVVWKIKAAFSYFSKPMEDRVERIIISSNEILVCCTSGTKFSVNSIGKTVFLSREEAEKALEVRE
jgi:hypothetical protein